MKRVVFYLALFFSLFMLFACSTPPSTEPAPAAPPPPPPAEEPEPPPPPPPPPSPPPPEPPRAEAPPSRSTDLILADAEVYTVVRGDTLSKIARKKYRNGFYYPLIIMASRNIIRDQDRIGPGMVLTIPKLQPNLDDARARESMKKFFLETAGITERKRPRDAAGLRRLANTW
jgi:hypothetical protein